MGIYTYKPVPDSDDPEADSGMAYFNEVAGTSAPTGKTIRDNIANGVEISVVRGITPRHAREAGAENTWFPSNCTGLEVFKNSNANASKVCKNTS